MCVKFFCGEPQKLRDEYTRYLYVLQIRKQLERGILQCEDDQLAAELAACLLQGRHITVLKAFEFLLSRLYFAFVL